MRSVQPEVFLVAQPAIDYDQLAAYLREVGGEQWLERLDRGDLAGGEQASDAQNLAEFAGKMCYRAWEPGLNPNVRRVRNDHEAYLQNILKQQHGSVLEHASFTFVLHNVSRMFVMVAEGSTNRHVITLSQNRGQVLDEMADTIRAMGLPAYLPVTGDGCVRTQCLPLRDFLAGLGHSYDKRVPAMVGEWSPGLIRIFLEAMIQGDGTTHRTFNHRVIYTSSREMADELQVLAIKAGWSANVRIDDRTGLQRTMPNGQRFRNLRPCYVVSLISRRLTPLVNHARRSGVRSRYRNGEGYNDGIEHYEGRIHCVRVPNGLLFVRRNGKPVVSGNTHELVRHRPGTAVSQESLRFVRLDEIPFWFPDWAREDPELMKRATALLDQMEEFQRWMAQHFGLDEEGVPFHEKKEKTSFMRRFAPDGVATGIVWTANIRTLRHTIEARTDPGAEEEIRLVFGKIGEIMRAEAPALFADYEVQDGAWVPKWRKV